MPRYTNLSARSPNHVSPRLVPLVRDGVPTLGVDTPGPTGDVSITHPQLFEHLHAAAVAAYRKRRRLSLEKRQGFPCVFTPEVSERLRRDEERERRDVERTLRFLEEGV